jgi:protein phosphatase PTC7
MVPTTKCLLVAVLWGSFFFSLSSGFQSPLNIHNEPAIRTTTKTTTTTLYGALEPLGREDTWQAYLDEETTGLVYYFDTATGESRWEPPTATFPEVRLPRKKQRLADSLRKEYRKTRQEMANANEPGGIEDVVGGFFSSVTSVLEKNDARKEDEESLEDSKTQEVEEEQPSGGFFNNFFSDGGANEETMEDSASLEESIEEEQTAEPKNPFGSLFGGESASVEDNQAIEEAAAKENVQEESKGGLLGSFFPSAEKKIVNLTPIDIDIGSHILPHPAKVRWGGEDATFVKGRTFGVFDGVSGAEKLDGVPLYSRTLASEMKRQCGTGSETVKEMTSYLTSAASYADGAATGASTAVVASIGESGFLQALNVGDSCCMVIRDGKVTAKTREISHYWECPYQLSEDSPDQPKDGTKLNVELISGDLVLMGSDGVFDNVNDDQLLELVAESSTVKPAPLAKKVCDLSRKLSLDKTIVTPYSKQAQRRGDEDYRDGLGGKLDDVSCIVVVCK